jgi:hypothetical protein
MKAGGYRAGKEIAHYDPWVTPGKPCGSGRVYEVEFINHELRVINTQ